MKTIICKNCDSKFEGTYCPNCSQSINANSRLTIKGIVTDFIDTTFSLDNGFIYTLWNLLKKPGDVARRFIEGKRKQYTNPVKYLFVATAFQALIEYLFMHEEEGVPYKSFSFLSDALNQNMHMWNESLTLNYPILFGIVNLLFWPIPLFFLFRKIKYNYPELIVAMMYFYGTIVILIEVMVIIYNPIANRNISIELVALVGTVYSIFAFLNFYKKREISWRIPRVIFSIIILTLFRMFVCPFFLAWFFPIQ